MKLIYKILFGISVVMTLSAIIATAVYGLSFGVDFKGGSVMEIGFGVQRPAIQTIIDTVNKVPGVKDAVVSPVGDKDVRIRLNEITETTHQSVLNALKSLGKVTEKRFDSIGPVVGNELKSKSITAIIVLLITVILYIAFVFRKMGVALSPWAMSVGAMLALLHDIIIPIGVFAVLGHYMGVEISAVFLAAILTILGYSISDTVVIFDRVRENVLRGGNKEPFSQTVHRSILQTLSRSINTNVTTLLSLFAIYFFGGDSVKYFALALIIGIFLGAYSSISIASPILIWWQKRRG